MAQIGKCLLVGSIKVIPFVALLVVFFLEEREQHVSNVAINHLGRLGFQVFLWNSYSLPIFKKKLIEKWQGAGITGYITEPVNIIGWHNAPEKPLPLNIPEYGRIIPTSWIKLIQPPPITSPCPICGCIRYDFPKTGSHLPNGIQIEPDSWDGSDILGVKGYNFIFCTKKVLHATLEAHYGKFIAFVKAEDWNRWEQFDIRKWKPKEHEKYVEEFLIRKIDDL